MSKMTQAQAFQWAKSKWGKDAWTELRRTAPVGEERKRLTAEMVAHRAKEPPFKGSTPEERKAWHTEHKRFQGLLLSQRCQLGNLFHMPGLGVGREIKGWGDTWEEAIAHAERNAMRNH
jgi:hypothetical protein